MAKRVVILGSLGTDEDAKAVRAVARFVADTQPDEVVCIEGSTTLLERLREGYGGPLNVHASTTDESFDAVLDRFGARLLPQFNKVAPGWITTRGHRGQISLSRIGGNTALNAAIKFGTSVVGGPHPSPGNRHQDRRIRREHHSPGHRHGGRPPDEPEAG